MIMTPHQSSLTRRLTAAAILATGFGTLWFMLVIWVGTSAPQAWRAALGALPGLREHCAGRGWELGPLRAHWTAEPASAVRLADRP